MTGETILNAIRTDSSLFPKFASQNIKLYDYKDCEYTQDSVEFVEDLFVAKPEEKERFLKFLGFLEKNTSEECIKFVITENHVIGNYKTPNASIFSRKSTLTPLDYMG